MTKACFDLEGVFRVALKASWVDYSSLLELQPSSTSFCRAFALTKPPEAPYPLYIKLNVLLRRPRQLTLSRAPVYLVDFPISLPFRVEEIHYFHCYVVSLLFRTYAASLLLTETPAMLVMPLQKSKKLDEYMQLLLDNYNPAAAEGLMCRNTLSVGWDGRVYDCDFNQQLEIGMAPPGSGRSHTTVFDLQVGMSVHACLELWGNRKEQET